ncbi:hypothetical protein [Bosea sp. NBC_00550]|uniref:hypothetical protein n=1 Tax=Bosea sp. NBC_00550 TaxID=2969621 RepID=UPI00222F795E|nr:hypothetical protein [Bosea sp. NBC_00550]UZF90865.1 hypothetical protein NWE53_17180 [Bosea sp. NBC_00550]
MTWPKPAFFGMPSISSSLERPVNMPASPSNALGRRAVLKGAVAALAAPAVIIPGRAFGATRLVVGNSGGAMGDAKQRAIYAPLNCYMAQAGSVEIERLVRNFSNFRFWG